MNVSSLITILTFNPPSIPDDVFTVNVVVMVTAFSRFGNGPASDPETARITGKYLDKCSRDSASVLKPCNYA